MRTETVEYLTYYICKDCDRINSAERMWCKYCATEECKKCGKVNNRNWYHIRCTYCGYKSLVVKEEIEKE